INAHGDSSSGAVVVEAVAPSGRLKQCHVLQKANSFTATFTPNEVGEWRIGILYDGEHIRGSPFSCNVYDANLVQVYGLDVGLVGQELKFSVNASQAGEGFVKDFNGKANIVEAISHLLAYVGCPFLCAIHSCRAEHCNILYRKIFQNCSHRNLHRFYCWPSLVFLLMYAYNNRPLRKRFYV
ncbi:Filamin-A, partial [Toxocara canis]